MSKNKFNVRDFAVDITEKLSDSIGDMIITVAITGMTLAYMQITEIIPPVYKSTLPGIYIAGMLVQLFIRIVHRFDQSYTTDEVGKQLARFEDELNAKIDKLTNA